MTRETMLLQIIKRELQYLIDNPEFINDVTVWIPFLQTLSDKQILKLWEKKFVD